MAFWEGHVVVLTPLHKPNSLQHSPHCCMRVPSQVKKTTLAVLPLAERDPKK